jgi:hypothetical protein
MAMAKVQWRGEMEESNEEQTTVEGTKPNGVTDKGNNGLTPRA